MQTAELTEPVLEALTRVTHIGSLILKRYNWFSGKYSTELHRDLKYYFNADGQEEFYTAWDDDPQLASLHFFEHTRIWGEQIKAEHRITELAEWAREDLERSIREGYFKLRSSHGSTIS